MMQFEKATKEQSKLRLALFGPSGSGKTFSALRIATGLGGQIAVIDTERGSASKYADLFSFDVLELEQFGTRVYVEAINAAQHSGYDVLIIDSLTHGWHDLLQEVDRIARAKFGGNTWAAWSEGTPLQRAMVNAILRFDGHIIATMRTKTEWALQQNDRGKIVPVRIGLAPEQGKGIEYEFDMLMEINAEHYAVVTKDRTNKFQDKSLIPDEPFGKALAEWLLSGDVPERKERARPEPEPEQREPMPRKDAPAHPARKAPAPAQQQAPTDWKQDGPTGKRPPVKGGGWTSAATQLSEKEPYYQAANGSPDFFHMLGAAGKIGYLEINDANLADVIADLEGYANGVKAEAEQVEQLAAEAV